MLNTTFHRALGARFILKVTIAGYYKNFRYLNCQPGTSSTRYTVCLFKLTSNASYFHSKLILSLPLIIIIKIILIAVKRLLPKRLGASINLSKFMTIFTTDLSNYPIQLHVGKKNNIFFGIKWIIKEWNFVGFR